MNDVAALDDGRWQWNGWLDPKGRVRALFALLRADTETFLLLTTAGAEPLAASLTRFVFRSKVRIEALNVPVSGRLGAPEAAVGALSARVPGGIELDFSGDAGARTLHVASGDTAGEAPSEGPRADEARWWAMDIAHGWPALPGVALDAWTPQQLSLERLGAFSVRKGCYPGQEIVARTHFLGRAKRGLARISHPGLSPGDEILDAEGRAVGQVACVAGDDALAVVPLEPADARLHVGGAAVQRMPLAGGLGR